MVLNPLKKIIDIKHDFTTYRMGIIQDRAYRALKHHTGEHLKPFGISTVEWALLGLLYDNKEGLCVNEIAQRLGVEATFVTALSNKLVQSGIITKTVSSQDKRRKMLLLTGSGKTMVNSVERKLRSVTKPLLAGLSMRDILTYRKVLLAISENYQQNKDNQ